MLFIILLLSMPLALEGCQDNCVKVNGMMYRLFHENYHWQDAQNACQNRRGRLARDTNDVVHQSITDLLRNASATSGWLGATTGPLYWNWIISSSSNHKPMYYQGCFKGGDKMNKNCKSNANFIGDCLAHCRFYNYSTVFKDGGTKQTCCCGNAFGRNGPEDPGRCKACVGVSRCGDNSNINAIYSTTANPVDINQIPWRTNYPEGLSDEDAQGLCTLAHGTLESTKLTHRQCSETTRPLCMLEKKKSHGNCVTGNGMYPEYSMPETGNCVKVLSQFSTWEEAIQRCAAEDSSRQSQLVSLHDPKVYRDVRSVMSSILKKLKESEVELWVFGSSRRWVWSAGTSLEEREDVLSNYWSTTDDRLPLQNRCLNIHDNGTWTAVSCDQIVPAYVCESGEESGATGSSVSTSHVTESSTHPGNPSGGSSNIAAVIGGTVGALLVVILIVIAILIWWIKYRRNPGTKENQNSYSKVRKSPANNGNVTSKGAGQPIEPHIYETLDENVDSGRTPRMTVPPPKPPRLQADDRSYEDVNDLPGFQPQGKGSHDNRAYESVDDTVGNVPSIIKDHVSPGRTSRSNMADLVEKDRMNKLQAVVKTTEEGSQGDSKPEGKPDIGRKPVTGRKVETTDYGLPETQQPKQGRKSIDSASHDTYATPNKDKKTPKGVTEANVGQNGEQTPMYLELISDEPLEPPGDDGEIVMVENEIYNS